MAPPKPNPIQNVKSILSEGFPNSIIIDDIHFHPDMGTSTNIQIDSEKDYEALVKALQDSGIKIQRLYYPTNSTFRYRINIAHKQLNESSVDLTGLSSKISEYRKENPQATAKPSLEEVIANINWGPSTANQEQYGLVNFMVGQGYPPSNGYCYGVTQLATRGTVLEDQATFLKRLAIINKLTTHCEKTANSLAALRVLNLPSHELWRDYEAQIEMEKVSILKEMMSSIMDELQISNIDMYLDLRAFTDTVALAQTPAQFAYLTPFDIQGLDDQYKNRFEKLTLPEQLLEPKKGKALVGIFTAVFTLNEIKSFLNQLTTADPPIDYPLSIQMNSGRHITELSYNHEKGKWLYLDANQLPPRLRNVDEVAGQIMQGCYGLNIAAISSQFYVSEANSEKFKQSFGKLIESKEIKSIQKPTPEKAKFVNSLGINCLALAVRAVSDKEFIKDLLLNGADKDNLTVEQKQINLSEIYHPNYQTYDLEMMSILAPQGSLPVKNIEQLANIVNAVDARMHAYFIENQATTFIGMLNDNLLDFLQLMTEIKNDKFNVLMKITEILPQNPLSNFTIGLVRELIQGLSTSEAVTFLNQRLTDDIIRSMPMRTTIVDKKDNSKSISLEIRKISAENLIKGMQSLAKDNNTTPLLYAILKRHEVELKDRHADHKNKRWYNLSKVSQKDIQEVSDCLKAIENGHSAPQIKNPKLNKLMQHYNQTLHLKSENVNLATNQKTSTTTQSLMQKLECTPLKDSSAELQATHDSTNKQPTDKIIANDDAKRINEPTPQQEKEVEHSSPKLR